MVRLGVWGYFCWKVVISSRAEVVGLECGRVRVLSLDGLRFVMMSGSTERDGFLVSSKPKP